MFPLALEGAVHVKDSVVLLALLVWVTPWSPYKKMSFVKNNVTILINTNVKTFDANENTCIQINHWNSIKVWNLIHLFLV